MLRYSLPFLKRAGGIRSRSLLPGCGPQEKTLVPGTKPAVMSFFQDKARAWAVLNAPVLNHCQRHHGSDPRRTLPPSSARARGRGTSASPQARRLLAADAYAEVSRGPQPQPRPSSSASARIGSGCAAGRMRCGAHGQQVAGRLLAQRHQARQRAAPLAAHQLRQRPCGRTPGVSSSTSEHALHLRKFLFTLDAARAERSLVAKGLRGSAWRSSAPSTSQCTSSGSAPAAPLHATVRG